MKAIVVGAGIGGLSAAIALHRAGHEVALFERSSQLHEVGSGLTLWVNAMRALEKLGVAGPIREHGARFDEIENRSSDGDEFKPLPIEQTATKLGGENISIHRGDLQRALASAVPEGVLRLGRECTGFEQDAEGVTVRFADGGEERADVLIGADGINSTVRAGLFGKPELRYGGYTCWRSATPFEHAAMKPHTYIQVYGDSSNFGIFPIGGGRWSWYGTKMTPAGQTQGDGATWKRQALEQFRDWYAPVPAVIEATPDRDMVRQDIYDLKPTDTWSKGRVTLLGDAAHATTPALGQGGCMAIEDAVVLARSLSADGDVPAALERYEESRKARANGIVKLARRHGAFYHGSNPVIRFVRDNFFKRAPTGMALRSLEKLIGYEV